MTRYVDMNGRFWTSIPGLPGIVSRFDDSLTLTIGYATARYALVELS